MTFWLRLFFIFLFSDNTIFDEQESKIILTLYSTNIIRRKKEFHTPRNKIRPITNIDKLSRTVFDKRFKRIRKAIIFPDFLYFLNTKIPKHSLRIEFQIIPFFFPFPLRWRFFRAKNTENKSVSRGENNIENLARPGNSHSRHNRLGYPGLIRRKVVYPPLGAWWISVNLAAQQWIVLEGNSASGGGVGLETVVCCLISRFAEIYFSPISEKIDLSRGVVEDWKLKKGAR